MSTDCGKGWSEVCLSCNFNAFPYQGYEWRSQAVNWVRVCVSVTSSPVHPKDGVTPIPVKKCMYVCMIFWCKKRMGEYDSENTGEFSRGQGFGTILPK